MDTWGKGAGGTAWESRIDIDTLPRVKQIAVRSSCVAQGAQLEAL